MMLRAPGVVRRSIECSARLLVGALIATRALHAQVATAVDSVPRGLTPTIQAQNVIERARGLAGAGRGAEARLLLDSLIVASANTSANLSVNAAANADANLGEALYWRATLSEQAADAERDWKRLVLDVPLSARAPAALLKLGDSETTRGRSSVARTYYERLLRDYGAAPERWRATLGISRSYFDDRDVAHACATVAGTRTADVPEGELRLQAQALQTRCANEQQRLAAVAAPGTAPDAKKDGVADRTTRPADKATDTPPGTSSGARYSVQVAAYDTRSQADAVVKKLAKRGFKARVDGVRKPFRVRVGTYPTRAEADVALARMKKAGQKGFVAEVTP
jgi:cell division septation protein DedD